MNSPIWYPYAQMKNLAAPLEVESASGVHLHLKDGRTLIDSISSWWCKIHGYNHPEITQVAKDQLDTLEHVMLGGLTHQPAQKLADKLVEITPEGLNHVFFADSGSVGVEVSLKMTLQYWINQDRPEKKKIATLTRSYHGDTLGCMSVCDPFNSMHKAFSHILMPQLFLDTPTSGFEANQIQLEKEIDELNRFIKNHHHELAGFIVEPIIQSVGNFNFYSPEYLQAIHNTCKENEVLLIFDEIATGFGRTGKWFAANHASITPDIMVLGKGLTAGYFGHSATLATSKVFEAFWGNEDKLAFMHGPTFMGNATVCAVALKGIEIFERENYLDKIAHIEDSLKSYLLDLQSDKIHSTRVLGAVGVIQVKDSHSLEGLQDFAADRGVWLRPFDHVVYTAPPYIINDESLEKIALTMREWFIK